MFKLYFFQKEYIVFVVYDFKIHYKLSRSSYLSKSRDEEGFTKFKLCPKLDIVSEVTHFYGIWLRYLDFQDFGSVK